jgi:hypothetical protein
MKSLSLKTFPTSLNVARERYLTLRLALFLTGAGLLALFIALLYTIQFSTPNLVSNDDYFHIKFAEVMREEGLRPPFPWLPLTILNENEYFDHHFLYHVLLIPFTYGDLRQGAKWAAVLFTACAFLMGWWLLRGQRVPYAAVWSLGFFALSEAFLYRMSMTRVQSLSLLMLFLMLHVTLTRRYRWLLPLAFIYTWLYDAFPFILAMAGIYVAMHWLLDRRLDLMPLCCTALGVGLGLFINPYFPNNLIFIYHHMVPKLFETSNARVGGEWYPYETWRLVENSGLSLLAFVVGVFALLLRERRADSSTATLFLLTVMFGTLLFKSRRFVEYYPAFVLLFCALAWAPLFESWRQQKNWPAKILPVGLTLLFIPAIWSNIQITQGNVQDSKPYERFGAASAWLRANTPPGSRVYQTDWDDFPQLYFYNTHNTYTLGLDPTYMESYNAPLYQLWRSTTRGEGENLGQIIQQNFDAEYGITDLEHDNFIARAEGGSGLQEVYRDEYAIIYKVVYEPD